MQNGIIFPEVSSRKEKIEDTQATISTFLKDLKDCSSSKMSSILKTQSINSSDKELFDEVPKQKVVNFSIEPNEINDILEKDFEHVFELLKKRNRRGKKSVKKLIHKNCLSANYYLNRFLDEFDYPDEEEESNWSKFSDDFDSFEEPHIIFMSQAKAKDVRVSKSNTASLTAIHELTEKGNKALRRYACMLCDRIFSNHASLGGHMSKNHPNSSQSFTQRKKTFAIRQHERKKRDFLRSIKKK